MTGLILLIVVLVFGVLGVAAGLRFLGVVPGPASPAAAVSRPEHARRIEEALTALDARIERLEDQQRFLERLLEGRPARPALPPSAAGGEDDPPVDSILFDVDREER